LVKVKKVPQRTCVGCREVRPKKALIRIVRTPENVIIVDSTGKANGRGAYVCPRTGCFEAAVESKRLTRSLEVSLTPEDLKRIREDIEALTKSLEQK